MRRRTIWLVLLVCAVPRLVALAVFADAPRTFYQQIADNMTQGAGYTLDGEPATNIEPLYPAMLALGSAAAGVPGMFLLQIAVACAGGAALFAVAAPRAGGRAAWIAVLLYAGSPYLVRQAASFVEITLAIALAIVAVWIVDRIRPRGWDPRAAAAGLVLGALLLTRFSFLPVVAGAIAILAWCAASSARRTPTRSAIACCSTMRSTSPRRIPGAPPC
jgi:4-amino-4-deoxy-L-arabinose transferase-like glycosyltransferase